MTLELMLPGKTITVDGMILDLDGSIVDSDDCWIEICCEALASYGITVSASQRLALSGKGNLSDHFRREFGLKIPRQRLSDKLWGFFFSVPDRQLLPMVGAVETVEFFAQHLPLGIATNNRTDYAELTLEQLGIRRHFQAVVGGDQVAYRKGKPRPDLFVKAAKILKVDPTKCVAVDDTADGITGGKAAGMTCVAVPSKNQLGNDFSHADLVVSNLLEIVKLARIA